ncbi:MAG: GTPase, partial [bacterium]
GKKVGFIGRPNVGKSSLINSLLNDQRLIVSEILGTTRDSIDIPFEYNGRNFILIDTPGIRRKTRVSSKLEAYSLTRALGTIKYADIVLLVIDVSEGLTRQDKRIAYQIYKNEKSCIVVANKFDIVIEQYKDKLGKKFSNQFTENLKYELANSIKEQLYLIPYAPVVFVSAKTGYQIDSILYSLITINDQLETDLSNVNLKELMENITLSLPAIQENGKKKRIKIKDVKYYKEDIPTLKVYTNITKFPDNYKSYLSNTLRKVLNIDNVPLRLLFVS